MKVIEIPILNEEYIVVVCWGKSKELYKVFMEYGYKDMSVESIEDGQEEARGKYYGRSGCPPIIMLQGEPKTNIEIGTLCHEAVHAIDFIFSYIGEDSSREVHAHSVAAIVRKVLK